MKTQHIWLISALAVMFFGIGAFLFSESIIGGILLIISTILFVIYGVKYDEEKLLFTEDDFEECFNDKEVQRYIQQAKKGMEDLDRKLEQSAKNFK